MTSKHVATDSFYEHIDQILQNKLHGPMHYEIGVYMCIL